MQLALGIYEFKYLADGEWFMDYAAFGLERGALGWNSVVQIRSLQENSEGCLGHLLEQDLPRSRDPYPGRFADSSFTLENEFFPNLISARTTEDSDPIKRVFEEHA